jgi:hypothetical protein
VYYQQNLRVQLQQRRNRLYKSSYHTYRNELGYLLAFIGKTRYLQALVVELDAMHPAISWPSWKEDHFGRQGFELPDDEMAAAKICLGIVRECAADERGQAAINYGRIVHNNGHFDQSVRDFTEAFVDPLVTYLHERVDEGSNVLYYLEKYKRRTEWFHRAELLASIQQDTQRSETVVDSDLREYLFDQGVEYPFSSPASPSGEADVVADVGEDRPLVLEIKLFDPDRGYDRRYVRKGFRQIVDYADDYGQSVGYLVVFNCSENNIVFRTNIGGTLWPPRVELDHRTFFLVVINLAQPNAPASKRGPLNPYLIDEAYLTALPSEPEESDDS